MRQFFMLFMIFLLMLGCTSTSVIKPAASDNSIPFDISSQVRFAEVDNLGHIYVVDAKNRLIKYGADYKELYRYASNRNGLISSIDVSNPLRITVFYDDFNRVSILDNTLSVIKEVDLSQQFLDITACGSTNDGRLWIYDAVQLRLVKIADNGSIVLQSDQVSDYGMAGMHIAKIIESGNYVVLCDYNKGFWFFDNFGQYIYHFPVPSLRSFQFDGKLVIYYTETGLKTFSIQLKERQIIQVASFHDTTELMYILYQDGYYYGIYPRGILKVPLNPE